MNDEKEFYFQDELRFGTRTDLGRRWIRGGVKAIGLQHIGYDYGYLSVAINPLLGKIRMFILPNMTRESFQVFLDEFAKGLKINNNTALVLLDEIQDPHNVGAIIRSAAAFGISGVLIPEHNQAPITGAVVKVSAGMAFRIPLVAIGNINNTIRDLKKRGFWVYGLDGSSKKSISGESFDAPTIFILGNEAKGIRQKTRELCDALVSIPIDSKCESLNVAASAAVALYAWSAKHDIIKS